VDRLAGSERPYLIGVRHHSPVLAAAVPALLTAFAPDLVLVELPEELGSWLPWLAHPDTVAPVALAVARAGKAEDEGGPMAFYPFADFSPELAAVRWAARNGVEVAPCDLPVGHPGWSSARESTVDIPDEIEEPLVEIARAGLTGRTGEDLWDRWVEAASPGSRPEAVRRAALAVGWAMRRDAETSAAGVERRDLNREAWMRQRLADAGPRRVAMVVGAFHAPALLDRPAVRPAGKARAKDSTQAKASTRAKGELVTSMVPYTFDLLDSRSGYPAGIRDPQWQQAILDCAAEPSEVERAAAAFAVRVTAAMRSAGHPAGPAEAREVARLAGDLARLRGLPAPGRGELVEALQMTLAQGEPAGRGRAVAQAMGGVLIGDRRGRVTAEAPASGLHPAVTRLLADLRLPEAGSAPRTLRLDPLRSPLDRRREVALQRLAACRIPYAEADDVVGVGGADAVTTVWQVRWSPTTDAAIAVAGLYGVTLAQAAEGRLRAQRRRQVADGGPTTAQALTGLAEAAACGLPRLVKVRLGDATTVGHDGTLPEIVTGIDLAQRLASGHVPGLTQPPPGLSDLIEDLYAAAVVAVDGLAGSTDLGDARALLALVHRADAAGRTLRLHHALRRLTTEATPTMQAAAGAVLVILELADAEEFGTRIASWVDGPPAEMSERLGGALAVAAPLLESGAALTPLLRRIEELSDEDFLRRLPALRGGFAALSPAARDRLLRMVRDRFGDVDDSLTVSPETLGAWLAADLAGREAVAGLGLSTSESAVSPQSTVESPSSKRAVDASHRWRLVLGRQSDALPASMRRLATALDELYGTGHGEGSYGVGGLGGGRGSVFPSVREWSEELESLFGAGVREEVLARAAEGGRLDVAMQLDPSAVRPSIELLHAVLALASGMPEAQLGRLRPLVAKLVAALTAQLARRLRPALTGLTSPRRTRRRTGVLDLPGTIRANLRTARPGPDGRTLVVPERPVFRSRGRRSVDWRLIVLTDVSGSMEQSTIWSALTASILAGVPALRTHFVTFDTQVVDLTDRLDDPLALLLRVKVGGGTHIAKALRYARDLVTVPARTMVVVVSDFEEGYPVGQLVAEVRMLVGSGCRLLGCASLDDRGAARYSVGVAEQLVAAGMPVAALSPLELARWVGDQIA
jgi:Mg-chelatase subunit ChlD